MVWGAAADGTLDAPMSIIDAAMVTSHLRLPELEKTGKALPPSARELCVTAETFWPVRGIVTPQPDAGLRLIDTRAMNPSISPIAKGEGVVTGRTDGAGATPMHCADAVWQAGRA